MKKLISFCLAAALLVTGAFAASFPDLENHWCDTYVKTLTQRNVINGMPDGKYHPDDEVTRGSIAKMLVTALESLGVTLDSSGEPIADTVGTWAENSITALASAGILVKAEYPNGFEQGEPMTRLETIKAVVRAYEFVIGQGTVADVPDFLDIGEISDADLPYVALGVELGIINGIEKPNGFEFQPSGSIQRATAAAMIARFVTAVETAQAAQPEVPDEGSETPETEIPVVTPSDETVATSDGPVVQAADGQQVQWLIAPGASVGEGLHLDHMEDFDENGYLMVYNDQDIGTKLIDVNGNVVLEAEEITLSGDGFYAVALTEPNATGVRLMGVMNSALKWHIEPVECCNIGSVYGNPQWYWVTDINSEDTYYDLHGNIVSSETVMTTRVTQSADATETRALLKSKFGSLDSNTSKWWTRPLIPVWSYDEDLLYDLNMTISAFREAVERAANGLPGLSVQYFDRAAGMATPEGKLVVPMEYDYSGWAGGDYTYAMKPLDEGAMNVEFNIDLIDYKCDIYDGQGNVVYTYYSFLSCHTNPDRARAAGFNPLQWLEYSEGLVTCTDTTGAGFMDTEGNIVIPCVFDKVNPFHNGRAVVVYDGQVGVIEMPEF